MPERDVQPGSGSCAAPGAPRIGRMRSLLFVIAAFTTIPLLGVRDFWHADEPRYAQVAREIARDGDWLEMHVNGELYTEKPPLYFWSAAVLGRITGDVGVFEARLPSALAGAIGVVLCFELGRRLFGLRIAVAAALMLVATVQWWWISQRAALDVMLATWVAAAMLLEEMGRERFAMGRTRAAAWWRTAAFAAAGAGFLVKGPPTLVFFFLALITRAWASEPPGSHAKPWWVGGLASLSKVPWLRGIVALFAVIASWGVPWTAQLGVDVVRDILFRQTAERMSESFAHAKEPWYYLLTLPGAFAPGSVAWLGLAYLAWRRRRRGAPATAAPLTEGARYLLAFAIASTVAFSCFSGKRNVYLMPLFPSLALLTTFGLARLAPAGVDLLLHLRRVAVACAAAFTVFGLVFFPIVDDGLWFGPFEVAPQSYRPLGELVRREADAGEEVVLVDLHRRESVLYYSGLRRLEMFDVQHGAMTRAEAKAKLHDLAEKFGERLVLVMEVKEAEWLLPMLPAGADPIERISIDERDFVMLRARAGAP